MSDEVSAEKTVQAVVKILKDHREDRDLSYDSVEMLGGPSRSTVFAVEKGRNDPTLLTAIKISRAMGLKLSDILKSVGD